MVYNEFYCMHLTLVTCRVGCGFSAVPDISRSSSPHVLQGFGGFGGPQVEMYSPELVEQQPLGIAWRISRIVASCWA